MADVTRDQITHLAQLAHLTMSDEQAEKMSGEVDKILRSVAKIQEVHTDDVPATSHPIALHNVFRDDVVGQVVDRDAVLEQAPEASDGQFKVPAILSEESR